MSGTAWNWSPDAQVAALRCRAVNEVDWDNIADESESVDNAQRHAVESLLINIISPDLYRGAIRAMYCEIDGIPLPPVSQECPFTLAALMTELPEPP